MLEAGAWQLWFGRKRALVLLPPRQVLFESGRLQRLLNAKDRIHQEGLLTLVGYERLLNEFSPLLLDSNEDGPGYRYHLFEIQLRWGPLRLLQCERPGSRLTRVPVQTATCVEALATLGLAQRSATWC